MTNIQAIHQLRVPGLKVSDPARDIKPGEATTVSDEVAKEMVSRGAARLVEAEHKDEKQETPESPKQETAAQKKAREKAEADAAKGAGNSDDVV